MNIDVRLRAFYYYYLHLYCQLWQIIRPSYLYLISQIEIKFNCDLNYKIIIRNYKYQLQFKYIILH